MLATPARATYVRGVDNPFAPPQADLTPSASSAAAPDGAYREGALLVASRAGARLPDVCVKSGQPTGNRLDRKLHWYPPWTYLFLLLNAIFFLIAAMLARKTVDLNFAVSEAVLAERKKQMLIGGGIILVGLLSFGLVAIEPMLIFVGLAIFLVGLFYLVFKSRLIWPTKMDKEWAWIKGVDPAVLSQLPPFAG